MVGSFKCQYYTFTQKNATAILNSLHISISPQNPPRRLQTVPAILNVTTVTPAVAGTVFARR